MACEIFEHSRAFIELKRLSITAILLAGLVGCADAGAQQISLDVVYPRREGSDTVIVLPRVDSTFAFGSVRPEKSHVWVNRLSARVWENGAFLAYVPLDTVAYEFSFRAVSPRGDSLTRNISYQFSTIIGKKAEIPVPHIQNTLWPARITIIQDHVAMRSALNGAYILFPPQGSVALADSFVSPNYRVRLSDDLHAWIEDRFVSLDTTNRDAPFASVSRIVTRAEKSWSLIDIELAERILYRLEERADEKSLILDLYGASSRINRIEYDSNDEFIREIRWKQLADDVLRLEVHLRHGSLWGYRADWISAAPGVDKDILRVQIRQRPVIDRRVLKSRRIVLDPGHGGSQPGAIGPTRLAEKEPNLKLALKLKLLLEKRGAEVFMTRSTDSTVELYDRVDRAISWGAEILISLHNNALSDGENPFLQRGSAVYYYHPQSLALARIMHKHLLSATGLPDHGFYYQNLALARPTEMLAVLIESAFMTHPEEEMLLRDDNFLSRTAQGLASGLEDFLKEERKKQ